MVIHAVPILSIPIHQMIVIHRQRGELASNYQELENLLNAQNWKEADQKTTEIMLKVAGQIANPPSGFTDYSLSHFSCTDLRKLDQLWVHYSHDRFGFTVQKQIWDQSAGETPYEKAIHFAKTVGWPVHDGAISAGLPYERSLNFTNTAPPGHLPVINLPVNAQKGFSRWGWIWGFVVQGDWLPPYYASLEAVSQCVL
jgi:hypothetical protein